MYSAATASDIRLHSRLMHLLVRLIAASGVVVVALSCQSSGSRTAKAPLPLSTTAAAALIEQSLAERSITTAPAEPIALRETTPDALFGALHTQTFRVTEGTYANDTFAVTEQAAVPLGTGFGGPGIVDAHVGDADSDGQPDLTFAYGSGSGIKRFEIGVYDRPGDGIRGEPRTRRVGFSYRDPVRFETADQRLEVWDNNRNLKLGDIVASGDRLIFRAKADLPRVVRERMLEPQF